jgi:hypothetical protein
LGGTVEGEATFKGAKHYKIIACQRIQKNFRGGAMVKNTRRQRHHLYSNMGFMRKWGRPTADGERGVVRGEN